MPRGTKRVFELNGCKLSAAPEIASWIISFGSGTDPGAIADQLRSRVKPIDWLTGAAKAVRATQ